MSACRLNQALRIASFFRQIRCASKLARQLIRSPNLGSPDCRGNSMDAPSSLLTRSDRRTQILRDSESLRGFEATPHPSSVAESLLKLYRRSGVGRPAPQTLAVPCIISAVFERAAVPERGTDFFRFFILAPRVGLEPTTLRLTAECSTIELPRNQMRFWARARARMIVRMQAGLSESGIYALPAIPSRNPGVPGRP